MSTRHRATILHAVILAIWVTVWATLPVVHAQSGSTSSPRDGLIVSSEWLKQHAGDEDLVVLQVSEKGHYDSGHIPGARLLDADVIVSHGHGSENKLMLELPDRAMLLPYLESIGIGDHSQLVLYFISDEFPSATRALLTLDAAGLKNRISILDGGLRGWQRGGNALTKDVPVFLKGKLSPLPPRSRVVDGEFVRQNLNKPGYKIIDARAPVFYDGRQAGMTTKLKGHIPGAMNIPFTSITATDLSFKSADELSALFKAAGVTQGDRIIAYCHIGYQGTAVVFAARTLGIDAVLYDGSFQDWSQRDLPVETSTPSIPKAP